MQLIYEDLTHEIIGCFFHVHNSLGVGYDEKTYHNGVKRRFGKVGINFRSKEKKALLHRGHNVRGFEADLIAFDKIILELKRLKSRFVQAHYVQIISELKLWDMHLGLLVNFGLQKVEVERIPFTQKSKIVNENYDYVRDCMSEKDRQHLAKLREAILYVFEAHGLGYASQLIVSLSKPSLILDKSNFRTEAPLKFLTKVKS